jgi:hypothetical protein
VHSQVHKKYHNYACIPTAKIISHNRYETKRRIPGIGVQYANLCSLEETARDDKTELETSMVAVT